MKFQVKELYGLDDDIPFRNVTVVSENRPRPLHLGTATQIGNDQTVFSSVTFCHYVVMSPQAEASVSGVYYLQVLFQRKEFHVC